MPKYMCQICNYNTYKKSDLIKHNKTAKHILKISEQTNIKEMSNIEFKLKLECKDKELKSKDKELKAKDKIINILQQQLDKTIDLSKANTNVAQTLATTQHDVVKVLSGQGIYNYAVSELQNNPPLRMDDIKYLLDEYTYLDDNKFENYLRTITYYFRNGILDRFLGDKIVVIHQKENIEFQSIFATDASRNTFLFKELVDVKDKNNATNSVWTKDVKAVKLIKKGIVPYLEQFAKHVSRGIDYCIKKQPVGEVLDYEIIETSLIEIKRQIDSKYLHKKVAQYISAPLKFDQNKMKKTKNIKNVKIEELDDERTEIAEYLKSDDKESYKKDTIYLKSIKKYISKKVEKNNI